MISEPTVVGVVIFQHGGPRELVMGGEEAGKWLKHLLLNFITTSRGGCRLTLAGILSSFQFTHQLFLEAIKEVKCVYMNAFSLPR